MGIQQAGYSQDTEYLYHSLIVCRPGFSSGYHTWAYFHTVTQTGCLSKCILIGNFDRLNVAADAGEEDWEEEAWDVKRVYTCHCEVRGDTESRTCHPPQENSTHVLVLYKLTSFTCEPRCLCISGCSGTFRTTTYTFPTFVMDIWKPISKLIG